MWIMKERWNLVLERITKLEGQAIAAENALKQLADIHGARFGALGYLVKKREPAAEEYLSHHPKE
jgi:hypothetical protein